MSTTQIPGAETILKALADQGVEVIFGYPGGAVLPIYDAIYQQNQLFFGCLICQFHFSFFNFFITFYIDICSKNHFSRE